MSDPTDSQDDSQDSKPIPRGSSSPDPGVSGALKDAIGAIAKTFGPASITQLKARHDQQEAQGTGTEQRLDAGRYESDE